MRQREQRESLVVKINASLSHNISILNHHLGLEADLEARDFWLKYLPKERVLACDAKDNFWEVSHHLLLEKLSL